MSNTEQVKEATDEKVIEAPLKRVQITLYGDGVPLIGDGAPLIQHVEDVLRYFATVHDRFGNTVVTLNGSWGGSACHAQDRLTKENDALVSELTAVKADNTKMQVALESISGTISADYAIRRANEVLAEIGAEGY